MKKPYIAPDIVLTSIEIAQQVLGTSREDFGYGSDSDAKSFTSMDDDNFTPDLWADEEDEEY